MNFFRLANTSYMATCILEKSFISDSMSTNDESMMSIREVASAFLSFDCSMRLDGHSSSG